MKNSPFKFLEPFQRKDQAVFFGREEEIKNLNSLIYQSPILLVYGYSGTGKTSVVSCGLASKFSRTDWMPFFIRRNENINDSLLDALRAKIVGLQPEATIYDCLNGVFSDFFRPIYLIFDQFEELFILGNQEEQTAFIETVKNILSQNLPVKIIIIMREEYLGSLYQFEKVIPILFDYKFRVEKMTLEKIKQVIIASFDKFNIQVNSSEKIEQIIENVRYGNLGIQLPYLQVYLDEIYEEDFARTYPGRIRKTNEFPEIELTTNEITQFGQIENVLEKFLIKKEREISKELGEFHPELSEESIRELIGNFITDQGTKKMIPYQLENGKPVPHELLLDDLPFLSKSEISDCIIALEKNRIIRLTNDSIELAHDSLAAIVHRLRDHELLKLKEVKDQLNSLYATYLETNSYLNKKKLNYFEKYLPLLQFPNEIEEYIEESRKQIRRKRLFRIIGGTMTVLFIGAISIFSLNEFSKIINQKENLDGMIGQLKTSISKLTILGNLKSTSSEALEQSTTNPTIARQTAEKLIQEAEQQGYTDSLAVVKKLLSRLNQQLHIQPTYVKEFSISKRIEEIKFLSQKDSVYHLFSLTENDSFIQRKVLNGQYEITKEILFEANETIYDFELADIDGTPSVLGVTNRGGLYLWDQATASLVKKQLFKKQFFNIEKGSEPNVFFVTTEKEIHLIRFRNNQFDIRLIKRFPQKISKIKSNSETNYLALTLAFSRVIYLLNPYTLRELELNPQNRVITDFDLSNNGNKLALAYENGTAGIWDVKSKKETSTFQANNYIQTIAFSPDQQFIATGDLVAKVLLWTMDGNLYKNMIGHESGIDAVSFLNKDLVVSATKQKIKIWNIGSLALQNYSFSSSINNLTTAPNDSITIINAGESLFQLDHSTQKTNSLNIPSIKGEPKVASFIDNEQILIGSSDHQVYIYNLIDQSIIEIKPFANKFASKPISIIAHSDSLIAIGQPNYISLRRIDEPNVPYLSLFHSSKLKSLSVEESTNNILAGYEDGSIILWDKTNGSKTSVLKEHMEEVLALQSFTIGNQLYLASGSKDNKILIWKYEQDNYHLVQILKGHLGDVTTLDFHPKSNSLLSGSTDNTVKIWQWEDKEFKESFSPIRHLQPITSVQFYDHGIKVLSASMDGQLKVWKSE